MARKMTHKKAARLAARAEELARAEIARKQRRQSFLTDNELDDEYRIFIEQERVEEDLRRKDMARAQHEYAKAMKQNTGTTTGLTWWVCADGYRHRTDQNCEHKQNTAMVKKTLGDERDYEGGTTARDMPLFKVAGQNVPQWGE